MLAEYDISECKNAEVFDSSGAFLRELAEELKLDEPATPVPEEPLFHTKHKTVTVTAHVQLSRKEVSLDIARVR